MMEENNSFNYPFIYLLLGVFSLITLFSMVMYIEITIEAIRIFWGYIKYFFHEILYHGSIRLFKFLWQEIVVNFWNWFKGIVKRFVNFVKRVGRKIVEEFKKLYGEGRKAASYTVDLAESGYKKTKSIVESGWDIAKELVVDGIIGTGVSIYEWISEKISYLIHSVKNL